MVYATRANRRDYNNREICKGRLIFQYASRNMSLKLNQILRCFYNCGRIKLPFFENCEFRRKRFVAREL